MAIRVKDALVPRGAVAGVAADAARGGGVALLPAADEVGLADEGAREADVFNLGVVQHSADELQAAQTAYQHTEYALTDLGRSLVPIIEQLRSWSNDFRPRLEKILRKKAE